MKAKSVVSRQRGRKRRAAKDRIPDDIVSARKTTTAQDALETRSALITAARGLFASRGYHATGTHEIVDAAGVTRGALQHYFPKKEDLFLAVFEEVRKEWIDSATKGSRRSNNQWETFRGHLKLFIRAALKPDAQRIVMIDGPAVLGWKMWRELQALDGLSVIKAAIEDGIASGIIRTQPPEILAYLIIALIEEAALLVTYAEEPNKAIARAENALDTLLSNMR